MAPGRAPGEALCPARYNLEALARIRKKLGEYSFSALYQQRPSPDEGTFFQRDWFKRHKAAPEVNVYITSDYAVSDGKGDFTEHGVWGLDGENRLYMLDWWSGQKTSDVWIERQIDLIAKHKPYAWFGEAGSIKNATDPALKRLYKFVLKRMIGRFLADNAEVDIDLRELSSQDVLQALRQAERGESTQASIEQLGRQMAELYAFHHAEAFE